MLITYLVTTGVGFASNFSDNSERFFADDSDDEKWSSNDVVALILSLKRNF